MPPESKNILIRSKRQDNYVTKKRSIVSLFFSIIILGLFLFLVFLFPPDQKLSLPFQSIYIPSLPVFFLLIFLFLATLIIYLFRSLIHGVLIGLFVVSYLLLRLNNLTQPFFLLILALMFLLLEFLFYQKKKQTPR